MKFNFTLLLSFTTILASAQITIQSSHLPGADDTLVTRNATFLSEVDPEITGTNFTWTFGFDILQPENLNADIICYDVNETPLAYQFLFNNPFDPNHNSDFGIGVQQADVATISFEDAYQYYKNSGGVYSITGMGASINGLPIAAQMNETDVIYNVPLTYPGEDSSHSILEFDIPDLGYYGVDQTRTYECDGWGTLNIWEQSFSVLRVRTVINATDSVFTTLIGQGFGFAFPRPETITYEWLSTTHNVPILKITTTEGVISQVQTADIYNDPNLVNENSNSSFSIFPNPTKDQFRVAGITGKTGVSVYSVTGELLRTAFVQPGEPVEVKGLAPGIYCIRVDNSQRHESTLLVIE